MSPGMRSLVPGPATPTAHPPTMCSEHHRDGTAGASARRVHERRKARREDAVRAKHPRIGALLLALKEPPGHERRWAHGAGGEEMVAAALDARCRPEVAV